MTLAARTLKYIFLRKFWKVFTLRIHSHYILSAAWSYIPALVAKLIGCAVST